MRSFQPVLALCLLFAAGVSAQSPSQTDFAEVEEAVRAATAAADDAVAQISDTEIEERMRVDRLTVENAMRQVDLSADPDLGEQLPQPSSVGSDDIMTALHHRSAWRRLDRDDHTDDEYKSAVAAFAFHGGRLYYREWSCETGGELAIASQAADLYQRLVTVYPERLMLRAFIAERRLLGYPSEKRCDYDALERSRRAYQEQLRIILE